MPLRTLSALSMTVAGGELNGHAPATLGWLLSVFAAALLGGREQDRELLLRIANGDASALKALYVEVGARALGITLRVLKDRAEAEDVLQETFLEVWKRANQYQAQRGGA